jgi:hypothetical protein
MAIATVMQTATLIFSVLASVALLPGLMPAQSSTQPAPKQRRQAAEVESILPSQKIGPGDLVSLSVADCPEMTRNFRVSSDGFLALPLLQEKLRVAPMRSKAKSPKPSFAIKYSSARSSPSRSSNIAASQSRCSAQ